MFSPVGGGAGGWDTCATVTALIGAPLESVALIPAGMLMLALLSDELNAIGAIKSPLELISELTSTVSVVITGVDVVDVDAVVVTVGVVVGIAVVDVVIVDVVVVDVVVVDVVAVVIGGVVVTTTVTAPGVVVVVVVRGCVTATFIV
jgi:hypothetical protein